MGNINRRKFIRLMGGGVVLAAGAGVLSQVSVFGIPPSAIEAWRGPEKGAELRRWVLSYALLAPNPHNMQPWLADLSVPDEITLRLDVSRLLPATDPYGRQILMGAGAFLELLEMAAAARGYRAEVTLFPEGEPGALLDDRSFATIRLMADAKTQPDPLFQVVLDRRTDRRSYDETRSIALEDMADLQAVIAGFPVRFGLAGRAGMSAAEEDRRNAIRTIVSEAWRIELSTEATMMESMRVLRAGSDEIDRYRDGINLTKPIVVILARTGLFDRSKFPSPDSSAMQEQIASFNALTATTPAYLWLVTTGNQRSQQIDAGRAYARVNLAATRLGIAMHPNQQALQEYPEMAEQYQAIHKLLEAPAPEHTVQMLARLGYLAEGVPLQSPAPRRGLNARLAT
jgi:hypothetical protein